MVFLSPEGGDTTASVENCVDPSGIEDFVFRIPGSDEPGNGCVDLSGLLICKRVASKSSHAGSPKRCVDTNAQGAPRGG